MTFEQATSQQIKRKAELEVLEQKQQQYRVICEKDKLGYEAFRLKLRKEQIDVEKLETTSLVSIMAKCFGQYEEKYQKEQREYLDVKEQMEQFVYGMEQNERELHRLEASVHQLKEEIRKRKEWMVQTFKEAKIEWTKEEEKKSKLYKERKEIEEAIQAIEQVLEMAECAKQQYNSANNWATYDTFFNGGLLSDMMKYDKINEAASTMRELVSLTDVMKKELKDVDMIYEDDIIAIDRTTRTFDIFFDNIFTDWSVKNQISDCLNNLIQYINRLELLEEELEEMHLSIDQQLEKLEND